MQIGAHKILSPVFLAPMAGVTDQPFRHICLDLGAGLATGEMQSSNPQVWDTDKSKARMDLKQEKGIKSVQIAGSDPALMAAAAQFNVENGAQIIDINMGCPAKKVNKKLAGSALLQDPKLVEQILTSVVAAVNVPVTLKIRTGWSQQHKNGVEIARIAEAAGIQALAVHGRTRECMFKGRAEYQTIRAIKQAINIPVIANGDICSAPQAKAVKEFTGADAVMVGRGAQGNPWLIQEICQLLEDGTIPERPPLPQIAEMVLSHVAQIHKFYGEEKGYRLARKHVSWYLKQIPNSDQYRRAFNAIDDAVGQLQSLTDFFDNLITLKEKSS
ncbi:tRNA dihydrouridine synthase DusB [Gayadomonas joobiniege]|uniref:tRNA dihydrouridine synthase DusB n=1 Tax=Gayadomonas joobiniege TaxID=1234606 RepID=UPI000474B4DF|nr:tRNA dihydrouridine synthase DusB [Gayadomonas joobiniege]